MMARRSLAALAILTLPFVFGARIGDTAVPGAAVASAQAPAPSFAVDPYWPRPLPDDWLLGNVVGVAADSRDNVWIIHRPNSQRGAEATPPVIAFDPDGNVVQGWGGPGDGYAWGTQTHGIHVDHRDNVWVGFGGGLPYDLSTRATTDNAHVLKFTPEGDFLLQIGEFGRGTAGSGSTRFLGQPTGIFVDPRPTRSTSATATPTGGSSSSTRTPASTGVTGEPTATRPTTPPAPRSPGTGRCRGSSTRRTASAARPTAACTSATAATSAFRCSSPTARS